MNVLIPSPDQISEKPSASSTLPAHPVPSPWTKPSHSAATCASVIPGRITPCTCSIAAAAISFASRMRSISCGDLDRARLGEQRRCILRLRERVEPGLREGRGLSDHAVGRLRPERELDPDRCVLARRARKRRRASAGTAVSGPGRRSRPRAAGLCVQAVRSASRREASRQIRSGSPSAGKTTASYPFMPQKLVR